MKIFKKMLKIFCIIFLLVFIINLGLFLYIKLSPKLEIKLMNSIVMYDNNKDVFYEGNGNNNWVSLNNISNYVIDATINTEDRKFYKHHGFDYKRIVKAMYTNVSSGKTKEGASTITQQYAKNLFLDFNKTWKRKLKEMWYTLKLEVNYSKDDILEGYLNTIYYGHGMYGIENASRFYFNKNSKDLTLAEATILVGIPKSPSNYSPITNYNLAKKRQESILYSLYKRKVINKEEYENALLENINIYGNNLDNNYNSALYYKDSVLRELKTIKEIPKSYLENGGIRIYTNLDINMQKKLNDSVKNNLVNTDLQVASLVMDPNNGKIKAIVGGKDYNESEYNRAYQAKRQVGSTMKPFLYYAALENGFTASTTFESKKTTFNFSNGKKYSPNNYNDIYANGPISLATAISYSDNVYAVKTHMFLGEDSLINMAKRLGITAKMDEVPSLPLGTASINIMELANAYSSFANNGYKVNGYFIEKVEDVKGNILYQRNNKSENILNKSLVYILNDLLTCTYDKSFIDYNYPTAYSISPKIKHKLALKSGTTNTDSMIVGYNKDLLTAVWVGYDNNKLLDTKDFKYSKNIWVDTIEACLEGKEDSWYDKPNNVVGVLVNPITGLPSKENDKNKRILYYVKGTEPNDTSLVFDEIMDDNILEDN